MILIRKKYLPVWFRLFLITEPLLQNHSVVSLFTIGINSLDQDPIISLQ